MKNFINLYKPNINNYDMKSVNRTLNNSYLSGATKIVQWVIQNGAIPADWALNSGILNVEFDLGGKVGFKKKNFSFTNQLK